MAKNSQKTAFKQKGPCQTPAGFMPKDQMVAHRLLFNSPSDTDCIRRRGRQMKDNVELISLYRLQYHGVIRQHVARALVNGLHYFLVPLVDERKVASTVNSEAGEGADPRRVPLKI